MNDSKNPIHPAAANGFTKGADDYVRGRPDYSPELVGWLRDSLGLGPGKTAVDLGAGTGKFTPRLLETGARVIAVEPVAAMRGKLSAALPQVEAIVGTADAIPLPGDSVDAVVCAQSFHWFATREALAEIHRVLKRGGRLGLVWNLRDERTGWVARLGRIMSRPEGSTPRYYSGAWRAVFPFPGFGPLQEQHFSHSHTGAPEEVLLGRVRSISYIAALPPEEQAKIEEEVRALMAAEPELRGKERVTVPYQTVAFFVVKSGG